MIGALALGTALVVAAIVPHSAPAARLWSDQGDRANANFGFSISGGGDVNGDGFADILVGAPGLRGALAYHGSTQSPPSDPDWTASRPDLGFGYSLDMAGDVNGDGYDDAVVGAYGGGPNRRGRAYAYHGSDGGLSASPDWAVQGGVDGSRFGIAVAGAGDVNGDGYDDVVVGAPGQGTLGRAFLYLGSAGGLGTEPAWSDAGEALFGEYGIAVGSAGDVNRDGYHEIVVGEPNFDRVVEQVNEGRAYLYEGSPTGPSATPSWAAESDVLEAWFGWSVNGAGDVNGDGYDDVIVGAHRYTDYDAGRESEGRAYVHHGSPGGLHGAPAWQAGSRQAFALFGFSVASAGDPNGDGFGDVVVGAPFFDRTLVDEGAVGLFAGRATGLSERPVTMLVGGQQGAEAGYSVSAGGRLGDGPVGVLVGSPF